MISSASNSNDVLPDLDLYGRIDQDGKFRYKMYNPITGASEFVEDKLVGNNMIYESVCRNISTEEYDNLLFAIKYRIFGLEREYLDKVISDHLKEGRMPEHGKNEVIIGSYAQLYYDASVGDYLDIPITLKDDFEEEDFSAYKVVGILKDTIDYFKGDVLIDKNTFFEKQGEVEENFIMIYLDSRNAIESIEILQEERNHMYKEYGVDQINTFFSQKVGSNYSNIINTIVASLIGTAMIALLLLYVMKGLSKKIGTLKSLGIPTKKIIWSIGGGLATLVGMASVISFLLSYASKNYMNNNIEQRLGYKMELYTISSDVLLSVLLVDLMLLINVIIVITIICKFISPRNAMLKS